MDRGRQIDNIQNTNAVFIDHYGNRGKTSVKTSNPPGGQSHFSLGWSQPEPQQEKQTQNSKEHNYGHNEVEQEQKPINRFGKGKQSYQQQQPEPQQQPQPQQPHTSVKISRAPGGQSNIVFGTDDSNYNHYRK